VRHPIAAIAVFLLVAGAPTAAFAQATQGTTNDQVMLTGDVLVPRGTVVDEVVVFSGSATIAGVARGDVVVLDGTVTISGQVGGDVVGLHGQIRLLGTAQVTGDVLAGGTVVMAEGAQVGGTVRHGVRFTMAGPAAVLGALIVSVAIAGSVLLVLLLLLLLAPRGLERIAEAGDGSPATTASWGVIVCVGLPVAGIVAAATVLGLPIALAALLGIALFWLIGLAAASFAIGRLFIRTPESRVGALFAGWGVTAVVGLVPVLNTMWWVLASVYGIGAIVVASWRARHGAALVPGGRSGRAGREGRGGRHRVGGRTPAPATPMLEPTDDARPTDMPLAED
jgi:hypothetical protein